MCTYAVHWHYISPYLRAQLQGAQFKHRQSPPTVTTHTKTDELTTTAYAGLLAKSQYSEGPATGHLDIGFSWIPCA